MKLIPLLLVLVVLASPLLARASDDETARLRAEIEQLKAALAASQRSCGTEAASPANTATASASEHTAASVPAPPPAIPTPAVPSGYKLVKVEPERPRDDRWRSRDAWETLQRGMTRDEVEALLGVDHSLTDGGGRSFWGYGKIGVNYQGSVVFVNDRLAVWTTPNF